MKKEIRTFGNIEVRVDSDESRIVEGYAVRFNEESKNLGFYETIDKGAITQDTINNSDVFAKLNHNDDSILARCRFGQGSLSLELREDGLYYMFESPHTQAGDELLEHIKRGEITSSSFAFTVSSKEKSERWYRDDNNTLKRTIYKIDKLYDVSPVYEPAYPTTTCSARANEIKATMEEVDKALDVTLNEIDKL